MASTCTINVTGGSLHSYLDAMQSMTAAFRELYGEWYADDCSEADAWKIDLRKMEYDGTSDATLWSKKRKWNIGNFPVV